MQPDTKHQTLLSMFFFPNVSIQCQKQLNMDLFESAF